MLVVATMVALGPAAALVGPSQDGAAVARFVIMVLNRRGSEAGYCSGVVLGRNAVLTAAHCVPEGAAVKVHFRDPAGAPVLLDIAEILRNPGYRADAVKTRQRSIDLALIRTASPLPGSFEPARLSHASLPPVAGEAYRLAGFGLTREGDARTSGALRVDDVEANQPLSNVLLWARDPSGTGAGACTGDSGGPVFEGTDDAVAAVMVWSAGSGRADCGSLTQAVWLDPQRAWIDAVLRRWSVPVQ